MTDAAHITEHSENAAVQLASLWATAIQAQACRIRHPDDLFEQVPDTFLQVMALHSLVRAAEMAKREVASPAAKDAITQAIDAFFDEVVTCDGSTPREIALTLVRDVLVHFDEYYTGTGWLQKADAKNSGTSREQLAQNYRVYTDGPRESPVLCVGGWPPAPARVGIDLVAAAPSAAARLVQATRTAIQRGVRDSHSDPA
jgi:hypothetical protein